MQDRQIQEFEYPVTNSTVRAFVEDGEIWVVAYDVLRALQYTIEDDQTLDVILSFVPDEWKAEKRIKTPKGTQEIPCLTEQGVHALNCRHDRDSSKRRMPFHKWFAETIVPLNKDYLAFGSKAKMNEYKWAVLNAEGIHRITKRAELEKLNIVADKLWKLRARFLIDGNPIDCYQNTADREVRPRSSIWISCRQLPKLLGYKNNSDYTQITKIYTNHKEYFGGSSQLLPLFTDVDKQQVMRDKVRFFNLEGILRLMMLNPDTFQMSLVEQLWDAVDEAVRITQVNPPDYQVGHKIPNYQYHVYNIEELAKVLNDIYPCDPLVTAKDLLKWLRQKEYVLGEYAPFKCHPSKKSLDNGWFIFEDTDVRSRFPGEVFLKQGVCTFKGLKHFLKLQREECETFVPLTSAELAEFRKQQVADSQEEDLQ